MSEETFENSPGKQGGLTPREILFKYIRYLPWLAISVSILMLLAFVKLRYSTPIYKVSAKLLARTPNPYSSGTDKFDDIFMMQQASRNLTDEMEIIRSSNIAQRVVNSLGLQYFYYNKGNIRSTLIHPHEVPFELEVLSLADSSQGFTLPIFVANDTQYQIGETGSLLLFNQFIERKEGRFRLKRNERSFKVFASNQFIVTYAPSYVRAGGIAGGLRVGQVDFSNVLQLTYETENPRLGRDILNQYMKEYQASSLEEKRQIAVNTLAFIDDQLVAVKQDLGAVERNLQLYQEKNKAYNPELQSQYLLGNLSETTKELAEQSLRLKIADHLIKYVSDEKNPHQLVYTTLGIEEPSLLQIISEFNKLQLERQTMLKTTPATSSLIGNLDAAINKLRADMLENLQNIRQSFIVAINETNIKNREADLAIQSMPGKQKQLLEITRQQQILQELYSYLLQKKLETAISSASTISNIRVVEPAYYSHSPIKPNNKSIYMLAILVGVLMPVGIITLLEYLNDKVGGRTDIAKLTSVPIIGEVGHSEEPGALVVTKNNRKFIAEQFRMVRTNFQYVLPKNDKPIILVTSTISGEGKSFISTNLGGVLAVSGRRTVILEFDIRKPKILKGLGLQGKKGITNFIVGSATIDDIIYPVPDSANLFVIPCGPVPPNPAEMLLDERVKDLFSELRKRFDVVIVDSAPVGLVSDAITLGAHVDAAMYIVRHNYTLKKQMNFIEELYRQQKLPHMSIIINDIKTGASYGGYYGYGGYGYGNGYGYGYGSDYFDREKPRRKGFFKRILNIFN